MAPSSEQFTFRQAQASLQQSLQFPSCNTIISMPEQIGSCSGQGDSATSDARIKHAPYYAASAGSDSFREFGGFDPLDKDDDGNGDGATTNIKEESQEESQVDEVEVEVEVEFHEWYLPATTENPEDEIYYMPILFQDGMDYVECELYYAAHKSSTTSRPVSPKSVLTTTHSPTALSLSLLIALSPLKSSTTTTSTSTLSSSLPSCLRPRRKASNKTTTATATATTIMSCYPPNSAVRRCSFSGMGNLQLPQQSLALAVDESSPSSPSNHHSSSSSRRSQFVRSKSSEDLPWNHYVGFEEYVQVISIPAAQDYPEDIQTNLWMSRREMQLCMRRGMADTISSSSNRSSKSSSSSSSSKSKSRNGKNGDRNTSNSGNKSSGGADQSTTTKRGDSKKNRKSRCKKQRNQLS